MNKGKKRRQIVRALICGGARAGAVIPRREKARDTSDSDAFGSGARKAMWKSVSPEGDEGVTMIAGRAAFSSTRGLDKSG